MTARHAQLALASVKPVLTPLGLLDAVGKLAMLGLYWIGWRRSEPGS